MTKFILAGFTLSLLACSADDRVDDPFVFQTFPNIVFNINLPAYNELQVDGGHISMNSFNGELVGMRGIIIYRENASTFRAFDQNCSFQPYEVDSNVDDLVLFMQCSGCSSSFSYDEGNAMGNGPAWRPLAQYKTSISGSTITITHEVINY